MHHHPVEHRRDTLLARIQADIRAESRAGGPAAPGAQDSRPMLDERDESLRVHSCHGRARQVEVVRDAILHALQEDPTLEPRDVIVMCPDIETFAPLIHATFGAGEAPEGEQLETLPADVPPGRPEGPTRRPGAAPDESGSGSRGAADRPRFRADDRVSASRPRRP